MLQELLKDKRRLLMIIGCVVLLIIVRAYEDVLFYDPLLNFFKSDFSNRQLPQLDSLKLLLSTAARYFTNTILSLLIIHLLFVRKSLTKFAAYLYLLLFILLIITFFIVLNCLPEQKTTIFYLRRFLIQPLFLLLFVPAFYFQEVSSEKNNVS